MNYSYDIKHSNLSLSPKVQRLDICNIRYVMDVFISYDSLLHIPMRTSCWSNKQAIYGSVLCIMYNVKHGWRGNLRSRRDIFSLRLLWRYLGHCPTSIASIIFFKESSVSYKLYFFYKSSYQRLGAFFCKIVETSTRCHFRKYLFIHLQNVTMDEEFSPPSNLSKGNKISGTKPTTKALRNHHFSNWRLTNIVIWSNQLLWRWDSYRNCQ